ncbi:MAG: hypothetical protein JSU85_03080, partial [Candidatus Zixiibacteriota bacterium]
MIFHKKAIINRKIKYFYILAHKGLPKAISNQIFYANLAGILRCPTPKPIVYSTLGWADIHSFGGVRRETTIIRNKK